MKRHLYWELRSTPVELRVMLKELGKHYPITQGNARGIALSFENVKDEGLCEIKISGQSATIRYSTPSQAGRAMGALLSGLTKEGKVYSESTPFTMLGIMLDCSRNAVMKVDHLKLWFRRLALLGYNTVMLYTEDTYALPGEPYFGYQRGAYTEKELKQIDTYAAKLNIEVIPCIQTLGHCGQILKHTVYNRIRDTHDILLVGEKQTYALIEKMVGHWKKVYRTDRIHVGMDETHGLGSGTYRQLHGYRDPYEIFNEHLAKVVKICKQHGLKPMIWSDTYFRLGSKQNDYYDKSTVIPKRVIKKIPKGVDLVYWDYYHDKKEFYLDWIERHRAIGKEPLVGSGIWTWNKYWYDRHLTETMAGPCIDACYASKVRELFFTQWGDNGAYCDHDSAFAGMTWCADKAYGAKNPSKKQLEKRFAFVCGGSYSAHLLASDIHRQGGIDEVYPDMWDDPFLETKFRTLSMDNPKTMARHARDFAALAEKLKPHISNQVTGSMKYAYVTSQAFADRYGLAATLLSAYRRKDKRSLSLIRKQIPKVKQSVRRMEYAFRTMWLRHNKPQGIETIQGRFGMVDARYAEMTRRIDEYIQGRVDTIPELECKCPPM